MLRVAWKGIQTVVAGRANCIPLLASTPARASVSSSQSTQLRAFSALSRTVNGFTTSKEYENARQAAPVNRVVASASGQTGFGPSLTSVRTLTKFSLTKGKRKSVKAVIRRFMRLHWGVWIRPKVGRHGTLWRKSEANRRRKRQHVFCNAQQSHLFDKMVTRYWRRPRFYVDDPYEPYHTREEFDLTRKKPRPFP